LLSYIGHDHLPDIDSVGYLSDFECTNKINVLYLTIVTCKLMLNRFLCLQMVLVLVN